MKCLTRLMFFPGIVLVWVIPAGCGGFSSSAYSKTVPEPQNHFTIMVWNVQALFDGEETGNEYGEYLEEAGWNAEKYAARLTAISRAVLKICEEKPEKNAVSSGAAVNKTVPDLIGFTELENAGVLESMAQGELSKHGYFWYAFAGLPGSSLGIGVLSRFPIAEAKAHSITAGEETTPRPILELRVEPGGKPLVFLLCHWKSKLGNDSEVLRRASARVVRRRLREIKESEADTPVIIMGDMNENHDEFYRGQGFCALLPDDPGAAAMVQGSEDFLVVSGEKPPRASFFPADVPALYSPWNGEMGDGSYHYKDDWETIDHFLLPEGLFSGSGWEFSDCRALGFAPFAKENGFPDSYVPRNGRGLSDHLPLLLSLSFTED